MAYLGWLVAAFLLVVLLSHQPGRKHISLRRRFARVDRFTGRTGWEITALVGAKPDLVVQRADGATWKVWQDERYTITLAFDAQDICQGVMDEHY